MWNECLKSQDGTRRDMLATVKACSMCRSEPWDPGPIYKNRFGTLLINFINGFEEGSLFCALYESRYKEILFDGEAV